MDFMNKPIEKNESCFDVYWEHRKEMLKNKLYNDKLNNVPFEELMNTIHAIYEINSILLDANKIDIRKLQDEQNSLIEVALTTHKPDFTKYKQKCDFTEVTLEEALNIIDDALTHGFTFIVESGNIYASYLTN